MVRILTQKEEEEEEKEGDGKAMRREGHQLVNFFSVGVARKNK